MDLVKAYIDQKIINMQKLIDGQEKNMKKKIKSVIFIDNIDSVCKNIDRIDF